jgi:imidazolonepropionase
MSNILLKNIKKIYRVSPENDAAPLSIFIQDGLIQDIAEYEHLLESTDEHALSKSEVIDCSDCIVLPGFVDSHTHLLFYGSREAELYMRAEGRSYLDILKKGGGIYNTVNAVRKASEEELIKNGLTYMDKALGFGTTTVEVKTGYGLDYETEKKMLQVMQELNKLHPVDIVPTFLVHTVPKDTDRRKYIDLVAKKMIPEFREYADWFDIFLEKSVFDLDEGERLIRNAMDAGFHVGIHTNQVHDIGGVKLAAELGVRHVDHLEVLDKADARLIIETETLYPVFLPTAESYVFSQHVGQIHQLLDIPSRIVLSTDFNPGSSPVLSPQLIMAQAVLRYRISDPFLLIDSFTSNPAEMLYLHNRGRIEKGAQADILIMALDGFEQIPYWGTMSNIKYIVKNGSLVFQTPD